LTLHGLSYSKNLKSRTTSAVITASFVRIVNKAMIANV